MELFIFLKTRELAHYLTRKKRKLGFLTPSYEIDRQDSDEIHRKILVIPYAEWKKMGFSKGTLFYLKKNARDGRPFTMNKHVRERLERWDFPNLFVSKGISKNMVMLFRMQSR